MTAERYEHGAIFLHPNPGSEDEILRLVDLVREKSGDKYFLMLHSGLDGFALCSDHCVNTQPGLRPALFVGRLSPSLSCAVALAGWGCLSAVPGRQGEGHGQACTRPKSARTQPEGEGLGNKGA